MTLTFEFARSNVTLTFDHMHGLDQEFSWSNFEIAVSKEWEGWLILNKGGGSKSFMTMAMTVWWPSSGVRIYQIVTGVASDASMPSTHLVMIIMIVLNLMSGRLLSPKAQFQFWCLVCRSFICATMIFMNVHTMYFALYEQSTLRTTPLTLGDVTVIFVVLFPMSFMDWYLEHYL